MLIHDSVVVTRRMPRVVVALGFVLALAGRGGAQDGATSDAQAREFMTRFYTQQAVAAPAPFDALWAREATDLAQHLLNHRRLHVIARNIAVRDLAMANLAVDGTTARADIAYSLTGTPAREGDPLAGFGLRRRVVECVNREGRWLVLREFAAEELLGDLVIAAPADARMRVVRDNPGWVPRDLVFALLNRAVREMRRNQAAAGLSIAEFARTIADESGDAEARARALETLGLLAASAGDATRAVRLNDAAQAIPGVSPDTRAVVLNTRGSFHSQRAEPDLAQVAFASAIAIRTEAQMASLNGGPVGNLAILAQLRSDYDDASRLYRDSLALAEAIGDRRGIANNLSNLGTVEHERGNYREAQAIYERVLSRATADEDQETIALALNNIGLVHRLQGRFDLARDYLSRSLALREASGDRSRVASTLQNLGMVERLEGHTASALDDFAKSLAIREQIGDQTGLALVYNSIGLAYDSQQRFEEALEAYAKSLAIAERITNRSRMVQALANIAIAERARGALDRAAAAAERTIAITRQIGNREQLLSGLTTLGQVLTDQGRPDRAQQVLDEAIGVVEGLREDAGASAQEQQRFFESRTSPYEALVALRVGGGDAAGALAAAERAKARALLDVLQRGRVTLSGSLTADERAREAVLRTAVTALNTDLRREREKAAPDAARIAALGARLQQARLDFDGDQARLYALYPTLKVRRGQAPAFTAMDATGLLADASTVAIEFMVTGETTYVFVVSRDAGATGSAAESRVDVVTLPVGRDRLVAQVSAFRDRLASRDLQIRAAARGLFDALLAPVYARVAGARTLIIVPDGALWDVPFQALVTTAGRYLVEDHAIAYAPSLTVLREMQRLTDGRPRRAAQTLFALGNPIVPRGDTAARVSTLLGDGAFSPLPETERQVARLRDVYGASRSAVFVGAEAREQRAKRDAGQYAVVHLATHGVLDDHSPMYSYVVLSPDSTRDGDDGVLEVREIMELHLASDLVVLSACETGRGRYGRGEGVVGMAWALFVAGTPATVVSQWKVDAASTTDLMVAFHRDLRAPPRAGAPAFRKADALQRASRAVLADPRYRHPFYWAGFVVIGDAR